MWVMIVLCGAARKLNLSQEQTARKAIYDRQQLKLHLNDLVSCQRQSVPQQLKREQEQLLDEERKISRGLQKRADTLEKERARLREKLIRVRSVSWLWCAEFS